MCLVKSISGKLVDQVEDIDGAIIFDPVGGRAFDKPGPLGIHFRFDLLAHGAA